MSGTTNLDWVWYASGIVLALLGLALAYRALLHDRARGRKRCPKCWYDMSGAEANESGAFTCPECGRVVKKARRLRKTRRRWRWATLALMLVIGGAGAGIVPNAKRASMLSYVPNSALPHLLIFAEHGEGPIGSEIKQRVEGGRYSEQELIRLYQKLTRGDILARPVSEPWRHTYGRLISTMEPPGAPVPARDTAFRIPQAIRDALVELPPMVEFRTRPVWPEGVPLHVELRSEDWWPLPLRHFAEVVTLDNEHHVTGSHGLEDVNVFAAPWANPADGEVRIKYRVTMSGRTAMDPPIPQERVMQLWEPRIATFPIRFSGKIDDLLTPIRDTSLTSKLASTLTLTYQGSSDLYLLTLNNRNTRSPEFLDIAIAGMLEFSTGGEVWARVPAWWNVKRTPFGDIQLEENAHPPLYRFLDSHDHHPPPESWSVRFVSDPEIALRVIDASTYWEGEVNVPVVPRRRR